MEKEQGKEPKPKSTPEPAPEVEADPRVVANRCPFCRESVRPEEERWVVCAQCLARQHAECWDEGGRCAACNHTQRMLAPTPTPQLTPRSAVKVPARPLWKLMGRNLFPLLFGGIFAGVGAILFTVFTVLWLTVPVWPIFPSLLPLVFVAIGGIVLSFGVRGVRRGQRLLREGTQKEGEVVDVVEDFTVRVNGRPRLCVSYRFVDENRTEQRGEDTTFDRAWVGQVGRKVTVVHLDGESLLLDLLQ